MAKIVIDMPDLYDIDEAAQVLGVGVATIWRRLKAGKLNSTKVGNRTLIPKSEIQRSKKIIVATDGLLSVAETAIAIGHCRYSVYKWIAAEKIIALKLGGLTFIPTSEVERFKKNEDNKINV